MSEGWHGVRFDKPLARTREYVEIVRSALARETVTHDGEFFTLPLPDGPGKALKLAVHPAREHVPIYLAAVGPKNLELAGEIADGWLAIFFSPGVRRRGDGRASSAGRERSGPRRPAVRRGRDRAGLHRADVATCADPLRPYAALYVGGMGSRKQNFYNQLARRMGFEAEAERVQDLYLDRKHREAMAAVPLDFIDQTSLLGPPERIAERLHAFAERGRDHADRLDVRT